MSLPDNEGTGSHAFNLLLQRRCSSELHPPRDGKGVRDRITQVQDGGSPASVIGLHS